MRLSVNGAQLFIDVSGPALVVGADGPVVRPTLVTVHGGPGL